MQYWMNSDTGKVVAREYGDEPYGSLWFEISEEEYNEIMHPLNTYTQEYDTFTDADPGL